MHFVEWLRFGSDPDRQLKRQRASSRVLTALLVMGSVLFGAAACVPISAPMGPGLVSLSRQGEDLVIAVCRAGEIREVNGSYRLRSGDSEWEEFLVLEGTHRSSRGELVFPPASENLKVVWFQPFDIDQEMDVSILVVGEVERQNYLGSFRLADSQLQEGAWLHSDGTSTREVCV